MSAVKTSAPIEGATDRYPETAKRCFNALRKLVFDCAEKHPETGGLTESLKWGEPSYAPKKPRVGTPVRLAWKPALPDTFGLFVNCQTDLIGRWRDLYDGELDFIGNREVRIPLNKPLPTEPLAHCIAMALTYHLEK